MKRSCRRLCSTCPQAGEQSAAGAFTKTSEVQPSCSRRDSVAGQYSTEFHSQGEPAPSPLLVTADLVYSLQLASHAVLRKKSPSWQPRSPCDAGASGIPSLSHSFSDFLSSLTPGGTAAASILQSVVCPRYLGSTRDSSFLGSVPGAETPNLWQFRSPCRTSGIATMAKPTIPSPSPEVTRAYIPKALNPRLGVNLRSLLGLGGHGFGRSDDAVCNPEFTQ